MEYTLCKKLKDAGFPQEYQKTEPWCDFAYNKAEDLHLLHSDNDTNWWIGNDYANSDMSIEEVQKDWVKCPTLSELIEACGDNFETLTKGGGGSIAKWYITGDNFGRFPRDKDNSEIYVNGSTPEEAVANLWLALNSK